jgi:hypothetical protein
MSILTIDFETFYSTEYSLTRMSEIDYIRSPLFQTIMCTFKMDDGQTIARIGHKGVAEQFATYNWSTTCLCSHNMRFDGAIAAWHFGVDPALYIDTLSMARALTHARTGRSSLKAVSDYLGLPPKGDEVVNARGKRLEDFAVHELAAYQDYCIRDTDNCRDIFNVFVKQFPRSELQLIDIFLRMFIWPQVKLNPTVLAEHLADVRAEKAQIMARVSHIDKSVFSSSTKFAALLQSYGVEPPRKISPTTMQETWALAKNDRAFKELCEDGDQPLEVQAILAARISAKSTLEETRGESLLGLSLQQWEGNGQGWAPVPIKYFGAHTGRVSGDGGFNWLNFKRGSKIRHGVEAPEGYRIVHRDSSQIEARMVAYLAGCQKLLTAFADPARDPYCEFASIVYGILVTSADKLRRFVGKTGILGLGYGCGPPKFRHMLFIGNGGISVKIDEEEAKKIVYQSYRGTYVEIPQLWSACDRLLSEMALNSRPINFAKSRHPRLHEQTDKTIPIIEYGYDAIWLPNGMCIAYPDLAWRNVPATPTTTAGLELCYSDGRGGFHKMYGAKGIENISQGLTRIIVTDAARRVKHETGYRPFLHTYDSLDYCVPESEVEAFDQILEREFAKVPSWAPGLPLASEGGWGRTLLIAENDKHPEHNQ